MSERSVVIMLRLSLEEAAALSRVRARRMAAHPDEPVSRPEAIRTLIMQADATSQIQRAILEDRRSDRLPAAKPVCALCGHQATHERLCATHEHERLIAKQALTNYWADEDYEQNAWIARKLRVGG